MAEIEMKSVRPLVENGGKYNNPGFEDDENDYEKMVCIIYLLIVCIKRISMGGLVFTIH